MSATKFLKKQNGSALIIALTAVALLGLVASATLSISSLSARSAQQESARENLDRFVGILQTILINPKACVGGFTSAGAPYNGLLFANGTKACGVGLTCLNGVQPAIRLDSNFVSGKPAAFQKIVAGQKIAGANILVKKFYLNITKRLSNTAVEGQVFLEASTVTPAYDFAPRLIGNINLNFDPLGNLISCDSTPSAQATCETMGCVWDDAAAAGTQKCTCGFPSVDCNSGGPGPQGLQYISGFDPATHQPICSPFSVSCANPPYGPGYFFAGIDTAGNPVCLMAEGAFVATTPTSTPTLTPTLTPTSTPTSTPTGICTISGTSTTGLGACAPPSGTNCRCDNPGDTFNAGTNTCQPGSCSCTDLTGYWQPCAGGKGGSTGTIVGNTCQADAWLHTFPPPAVGCSLGNFSMTCPYTPPSPPATCPGGATSTPTSSPTATPACGVGSIYVPAANSCRPNPYPCSGGSPSSNYCNTVCNQSTAADNASGMNCSFTGCNFSSGYYYGYETCQ